MQRTVFGRESVLPGNEERIVETTAIELPDNLDGRDNDLALLIHDVELGIEFQDGLDANNRAATVTSEFGFSTEEDGNPMLSAVRRTITLAREDTGNAGAQTSHETENTEHQIQGTIWAAPYMVLFARTPGGFAGTVQFRATVLFELVEIGWRDQLRLWNLVDETADRSGEWETL